MKPADSDPLHSLRCIVHELQCFLQKNPALTPSEELSLENSLMMMQFNIGQWTKRKLQRGRADHNDSLPELS